VANTALSAVEADETESNVVAFEAGGEADEAPVQDAPAPIEDLPVDDEDRDSLTVLPLAIVPLDTASLRRGRLVKNVHLDGVVEMFKDESAGSGQLSPEQLPEYYGWDPKNMPPDLLKVRQLASLNSFDIFSLRVELRKLGIEVDGEKHLKLSEAKSKELTGYMTSFTAPLIKQVYGNANTEVEDFKGLMGLFYSPNQQDAIKNLKKLSDTLEIRLDELPRFIEDYGDIFLSLAYFKERLDFIVPQVMEFLETIPELKRNHQLKSDRRFMTTCDDMEPRLNEIITSLTGRFENFDQHSKSLWDNLTAERFRQVRKLVKSHHSSLGGVLCGLGVKMEAYTEKFGNVPADSALMRRAEFIMADMTQGLQRIQQIEDSAPKITSVQ